MNAPTDYFDAQDAEAEREARRAQVSERRAWRVTYGALSVAAICAAGFVARGWWRSRA